MTAETANMTLLDDTRIGIFITTKRDGMPIGIPVWFDWDGKTIRCFAEKGSKKIKRLARDPRASLLITNNAGEPEAWVAFDGEVTIKDEGAIELAEKLAEKLAGQYYDLTEEVYAKRLASWKASPESFVLLEMTPSNIRTGG